MSTSLDRIAVVTGANAGLGFQVALKLARMGMTVVMACRNLEKAKKAQGDLLAAVPNAQTIILPLDLSEPASVQEFVRLFAERVGRLDLLINNAGIVAVPLARNSVGYESQLATNYLGAFALTGLLLPFFREGSQARIVNVGSLANNFGKFDLDDMNWEKTPYNEWKGYSRSKVAMLSFTMELDRRLNASGKNIIALGAHPGFAATDILRHTEKQKKKSRLGQWWESKMKSFVPTAAQASAPIMHAACSADAKGCDYFGPGGFLEIAGKPAPARVNPVARDAGLGRKLWVLSEQMTGVNFLSDV